MEEVAAPQWERCQPQSSQEWEIHGHRDSVSITYSIRPTSVHMSIIKNDIKDKLNKLTLFQPSQPSMATAIDPKSADMVYANTSGITNTMDAHDKFEERFNFRRSSDLPPPLPPHTNTSKDQITLPRVGTKPNDSLGSPRSPRVGTICFRPGSNRGPSVC